MACCLCTPEQQVSRKIDKELKKDEKRLLRELKLLLLGTGASGKSTFVKQMRIIHGEGFPEKERESLRYVIFDNVISGAQALLAGVRELGLELVGQEAKKASTLVEKLDGSRGCLEQEWVGSLTSVWRDPSVQTAFERRVEFREALPDSTGYFLNSVERLAKPGYVPTDQDILYSRNPTRSILEYPFELDRVTYKIVDVGGQRSERRKWIYCFEGVTSVIFLAAISEYDLNVLDPYNGKHYNGLQESIALFAHLLRHPAFRRSSFLLFLNKSDIFEEKVQTSNIVDHFPQYDGPKRDAQRGGKFFEDLFLECLPEDRRHTAPPPQKSGQESEALVYVHHTTATNTENIRNVFAAVKDTILDTFLRYYTFV